MSFLLNGADFENTIFRRQKRFQIRTTKVEAADGFVRTSTIQVLCPARLAAAVARFMEKLEYADDDASDDADEISVFH